MRYNHCPYPLKKIFYLFYEMTILSIEDLEIDTTLMSHIKLSFSCLKVDVNYNSSLTYIITSTLKKEFFIYFMR